MRPWFRRLFVALALVALPLSVCAVPAAAQNLATPLNNASTVLGAAYTQGSGSLTLATGTGALFGTPSPSAPVCVTVASRATLVNGQIGPNTVRTIYLATGRTGDTLTGLSVPSNESTGSFTNADRSYVKNDIVANLVTAGTIANLQTGVTNGVTLNTSQTVTGAKTFSTALGTPTINHGTQGGTTSSPTPQTLWTHQPIGNITLGPWQTQISGDTFSSQWDSVCYWGYNPNRDPAAPGLNTEHTWTINLEATYKHVGTNNQTCESYLEFLSPASDGNIGAGRLQRRPWGCNLDQVTTSTQFNIELGPPLTGWGYFSIRGGQDPGGDFDIINIATGTTAATSTFTINCPIVQNVGEGLGMQLGSYYFNTAAHSGILFSSNHFRVLSNTGTNVFLDAGTGGTVYVGNTTGCPLAVSGLTTFSANVGFHETNPQHPLAATATNARAISVYTGTDVGQYGALGFQFSPTIAAAGSEFRNYCPTGGNDADLATWVCNAAGTYVEQMRIHGATGTVNFTNSIVVGGGITPASLADTAAANGTIYYSTTAGKLVYKDPGGVVNALY